MAARATHRLTLPDRAVSIQQEQLTATARLDRFVVRDEVDVTIPGIDGVEVGVIRALTPDLRATHGVMLPGGPPPASADGLDRHLHDPVAISVDDPKRPIDEVDLMHAPVQASDLGPRIDGRMPVEPERDDAAVATVALEGIPAVPEGRDAEEVDANEEARDARSIYQQQAGSTGADQEADVRQRTLDGRGRVVLVDRRRVRGQPASDAVELERLRVAVVCQPQAESSLRHRGSPPKVGRVPLLTAARATPGPISPEGSKLGCSDRCCRPEECAALDRRTAAPSSWRPIQLRLRGSLRVGPACHGGEDFVAAAGQMAHDANDAMTRRRPRRGMSPHDLRRVSAGQRRSSRVPTRSEGSAEARPSSISCGVR